MEKEKRLAQILRLAKDDKDAFTMILSGCSDMANSNGVLLSIKKFDEAAEMIVSYLQATRRTPLFICAHCSGFAYCEEPFPLESGTTLLCDKCEKNTIVLLASEDDYCLAAEAIAEKTKAAVK